MCISIFQRSDKLEKSKRIICSFSDLSVRYFKFLCSSVYETKKYIFVRAKLLMEYLYKHGIISNMSCNKPTTLRFDCTSSQQQMLYSFFFSLLLFLETKFEAKLLGCLTFIVDKSTEKRLAIEVYHFKNDHLSN